ncbi:MAG TPA: transketolase C-terminal domain-containing protein [Planctomycetota bacterium]
MQKQATREAYGTALERLGHTRSDVVVLDADLSGSTKTAVFAKSFPDRFLNMGVAEANMIGHAAGLALCGKTVFASSFAMFAAGKAWEQIRQSVCVPRLDVKIVASHAGVTVGEDGASHQALEDLACMRVLPNMTVVVPADGPQTEAAVAAIAAYDGPCYLRVSRASTRILEGGPPFELGKARELRHGEDLALIACGVEVAECLDAAEALAGEGIRCTVLDVHTLKPLDEAAVVAVARRCGSVMTVEEHQVIGGLGEAVAAAVARAGGGVPMRLHGMQGTFGQTGPAEVLLAHYRLDAPGIAAEAREFLEGLA